MFQIHKEKQIKDINIHHIAQGFEEQTSDIPWVMAKELFKYHKRFSFEEMLKFETSETSPDVIAEIIAYFGKNTIIDKEWDYTIRYVVKNNKLTNEAKLEICVMLIES